MAKDKKEDGGLFIPAGLFLGWLFAVRIGCSLEEVEK
jgi:hypothetical protein